MEKNDLSNIKRIIKSTNLNFLFGAGTSFCEVKDKLHYPLMSHLIESLRRDSKFKELKEYFDEGTSQRVIIKKIIERYLLGENANIEMFLSVLEGADNYITEEEIREKTKELQKNVKCVILNRIKSSDDSTVLELYEDFYRALRILKEKTEYSNSQSFNVFTTNYDMLNEMAMENIGTHYYSGFSGLVNRKFNIAYYGSEYVKIYSIKNNNFYINENHINLFKLHGSISWEYKDGELYEFNPKDNKVENPEIIYPSVSKFNNTNLIAYYSALMREFSNNICKQDSSLVVCGTSLNDEHINKIIENALLINSFTLIIFAHKKEEIKKLQEKYCHSDNAIVFEDSADFKSLTSIISEI